MRSDRCLFDSTHEGPYTYCGWANILSGPEKQDKVFRKRFISKRTGIDQRVGFLCSACMKRVGAFQFPQKINQGKGEASNDTTTGKK